MFNKIANRMLVPPFLINSLPKSGTHLLQKTIALFPGIQERYIHVCRSTLDLFEPLNFDEGDETLPIGIDWPEMISAQSLQKIFSSLNSKRFSYATCHLPFSDDTLKLIRKSKFKTLLILRDPRDIVLSHANYIGKNSNHFLYGLYKKLSQSDRIMTSITGLEKSTDPQEPQLLNIEDRYRSVMPWCSTQFNYTTYFEKLVGEQGGGTAITQHRELENIAKHLGLRYSNDHLDHIANNLFGGTVTFRNGLIGNWKSQLSEKHKYTFKKIAGELLIELGYEHDLNW